MTARWRLLLVACIFLTAAGFIHLKEGAAIPQARSFADFPLDYKGWRSNGDQYFDANVMALLRPSAYLSRTYVNPEYGVVQLYIGYHDGGPRSGPIHSPRHCLPGSGWEEYARKDLLIDADGAPLEATGAVYGKDNQKLYMLYWYQLQEKHYRSEYSFKAASVLNALIRNRSDQSFIRIVVPVASSAIDSGVVAERFTQDFFPLINSFLPK